MLWYIPALIRVYGKDENPVVLSGYQFTFGGFVMIVIGYLTGGRLNVWTGKGIAVVIYLAFVSAIAYTVWSLLLHHNNVSKVAVFGCLNPVFGAILSALILKESGQSFGTKEVIALGGSRATRNLLDAYDAARRSDLLY